jgi:hypothetical protein
MVFFHNVSMDKWKFKTTEVCVSMYISSVCVCVRAFVSPCLCVCLLLCLVLFSLFSLCFSVSLSFFSLCLSISFLSRSLHLCLSLSPLCVLYCHTTSCIYLHSFSSSPLLPYYVQVHCKNTLETFARRTVDQRNKTVLCMSTNQIRSRSWGGRFMKSIFSTRNTVRED